MRLASDIHPTAPIGNPILGEEGTTPQERYADYKIIRRNGAVVGFEPDKIAVAMTKAFLAVSGNNAAASVGVRDKVAALTEAVVQSLMRRHPAGGTFHIEDVQDQVELAMMRAGEHQVARSYVLYREERARERAKRVQEAVESRQPHIHVMVGGAKEPLDTHKLEVLITSACAHLGADVEPKKIMDATLRDLYDGVPLEEVHKCAILAARMLIEQDPDYTYVTARLLLHTIRREVLGEEVLHEEMSTRYAEYFPTFVSQGVKAQLLDVRLASFDLKRLGAALKPERDLQFNYLGLQTLYDRYFLHIQEKRIELPQAFYMRVAMGLSLNEINREERAIEFYNVMSTFDFMSSTPTLFNAGTLRSQLSSCYLTTVADDLTGIYDAIKENALLAKYAGGLGNDWTPVRALGAHIKGTNGKSQGVVPFLKVVNDTAVAVNQGGKRKGAVCSYLETWHLDIEEFLELRKNTGDDRRRTHDMNTANWIPDLFMKRVMEKGDWTLFSPSDTPDLHDLVGRAFEQAYVAYEAKAAAGEIRVFKKIAALDLWRKMLSMLFETGHPWITFKDPCNIRSPQSHVGMVHSSNLCTEITLNTGPDEIAVCNLGSVNMPAHMKEGKLDHVKLEKTIRTAMRMLDNVIDINYYAVDKARNANMRHRPVGLGVMGFQDCLHMMRVPFASDASVAFADTSMEAVCYYAYLASTELAEERGHYASFKGSLWDRGILPQDSVKLLAEERGGYLEVDGSSAMDWTLVRHPNKAVRNRNPKLVANAATATISNIIGVSACIEPTFQNLYVKSNLSGEFTVVNDYLVRDLKERGLWDEVMVSDLKYFDGTLSRIDRVPADLRAIYATAFELDATWVVEAASRRQKWIDQAQSLNIYMGGASGKKLDEVYKLAWLRGLKTTYYLRTMAATHVEKSTVAHGQLNSVPSGNAGNGEGGASGANGNGFGSQGSHGSSTGGFNAAAVAAPAIAAAAEAEADGPVCMMRPGDAGFDECEACQ